MEYLLIFALGVFVSGLLIITYQATHNKYSNNIKPD